MNKLKRIIRAIFESQSIRVILTLAFFNVALWLVFCFIGWSLNPGHWNMFLRFLYILLTIVMVLILGRVPERKLSSPAAVSKSVSHMFQEKLKQIRES